MLNKKARKSLDIVIEKFQSGDLSAITKLATIELDSNAPARKWTYSNRVLAFAQTGDVDVRGYNQWKKMGRYPCKGQQSAYILGPRIVKIEDENGDEYKECRGFIGLAVFGYSQTDGDDGALTYTPRELPPLMAVAERLQTSVSFVPGSLGSTTPDGSKITMGSGETNVFFHELAHAAHAKLNGKLQGGQHTDQETVAEFVACVLMELYGYGDYTGNAWQYIASYCDNPLIAITKAMADVEQVVNLILESEADLSGVKPNDIIDIK